jgi:uncharacterized membrane protein YbhN (UPF0104 family)
MSSRGVLVARWAVALVFVGVLASFVDLGAIGQRLAGTDLRLAVPAIVGLVLVHVVAAMAWRRLLRALAGVSLGWITTLRVYYTAQVFGTVTPANLGADVYRVLAVGAEASRAQLAQPVIVQRLTSVAAIVCLGVAGGIALPIPSLRPFLVVAAIVGAIAAATSVAIVGRVAVGGWIDRLARRLGWNGAQAWSASALRSAARDGFFLGVVFHAISLLLGLALVRAVDPEAASQPGVVLGALAVARLSLAVPISPNGIGIQEGLLTVLFVQLGLPADTALAAALLNRLGFLLTAAVGAAALVSPGAARAVPVQSPSRPPAGG